MDGGAAGPGNRKGLPDSCVPAWSFTGFIGGFDFAEDELQLGPVVNGCKFLEKQIYLSWQESEISLIRSDHDKCRINITGNLSWFL